MHERGATHGGHGRRLLRVLAPCPQEASPVSGVPLLLSSQPLPPCKQAGCGGVTLPEAVDAGAVEGGNDEDEDREANAEAVLPPRPSTAWGGAGIGVVGPVAAGGDDATVLHRAAIGKACGRKAMGEGR